MAGAGHPGPPRRAGRSSKKLTALLDHHAAAQSGVQFEGDTAQASHAGAQDVAALKAWNLLANGSGGIDFAGLPLVAEWLDITDIDGLLTRLAVIRTYKPPSHASAPDA